MRIKRYSLFLGFIFFLVASFRLYSFDHSPYDSLLQLYVNGQGMVDYAGIKENPDLLKQYLEELKEVNPEEFESWSEDEKMAFWINAYNAITIEGIIRNYPIDAGNIFKKVLFPDNSIRQIGDFWDTVFIEVMGKDITLNDIEHNILRKEFDDSRIHAVLVCAAIGCPELRNRAYTAKNLSKELDKENRKFIGNPEKVLLDEANKKLYLSSIFSWYQEDFIQTQTTRGSLNWVDEKLRGVVEFVVSYMTDSKKEYILTNKPEIKFLEYDWTLNEQK